MIDQPIRLEWRKASELQANPRNWRRHPKSQTLALAAVLKEVGWAGAALYNENTGRLIDGHLRQELAGDTEIPVLIGSWTEDQEALLLATFDPIAAMAQANKDSLIDLLGSIKTEEPAIQALLEAIANDERLPMPYPQGNTDPDDVPETPTEFYVQRGDLWQLGEHRLMCGDSTNAEDVVRLLDGEKVDALLTDPPYGMNLDTDWSGIRGTFQSIGFAKEIKGKAYPPVQGDDAPFDPMPMLSLWASGVDEVFLFGADYYAERIPQRVDGSWLVWDKRKESQAAGFGSEFELIWSKNKHKRRILRHEWFGFLREGEHGERRTHPAQKPINLIVDIADQWCGSVVADAYVGSGTTIIAAERTGRRCYAMEIEPRYVQVSIERWQNYTGKQAVKA